MKWVPAVFQTLHLALGLSGEQGGLITTMVTLCLSGLPWLTDGTVFPRAQEAPSLTPAVAAVRGRRCMGCGPCFTQGGILF